MFNRKKDTRTMKIPSSVNPEVLGRAATADTHEPIEGNRWFLAFVLAMLVIVAQGVAIFHMLPLKEVRPYTVAVDDVGRVAATALGVNAYQPERKHIQRALRDWTEKVFALDHNYSKRWLAEAYGMTIDGGQRDFKAFLERAQPLLELGENPNLVKMVEIRSVLEVEPGRVEVRFKTEARKGTTSQADIKHYMLSISYKLIPPQTEEVLQFNPTGTYITHFTYTQERL